MVKRPGLAAVSTVFVDTDHLVDWTAYRVVHRRDLQLVPLHSWELAALLVCSRRPALRSIGIGLLLHLLLDMTIGGYSFQRLSLAYRIRHCMQTDWTGDWVLWPGRR
jgi:hypothetical protein